VPFSNLPYRSAYLTFLGVNLVLLAIAFWWLRPEMSNIARAWKALPVFMFLVFYPIALALMQGQDSILLLLLLAAALVALKKGRELPAGMLVGLGLFKLQIVIPVAALFLLWRRWRFTAGFVLSGGLVSLVSLWVVGFAQAAKFAHSLLSVGTSVSAANQFPLRVSIMANLRGLIFGLAGGRLPVLWTQALTIAASIFVLLWVARAFPGREKTVGALHIAISAAVIVSYYLFIHDLSVLLIPIVIALDRFAFSTRPADTDALPAPFLTATACTSAAALVSPMCIFLIPDHFYLVSLCFIAFMVLLVRSFARQPQPLHSAEHNGQ
jgi:hypothetical protein